MIVIWQPEIVDKFENADQSYADPPTDLEKAFQKDDGTVEDILRRTSLTEQPRMVELELQKFLLPMHRDQSKPGSYSRMHDYAVYVRGYFDDETKRLAYM